MGTPVGAQAPAGAAREGCRLQTRELVAGWLLALARGKIALA
jgi:hypothetical protein